LNQKWEWARKEAQTRNLYNGFWVGYGIQRMMEQKEYFVTGSSFHFDRISRNDGPSLAKLLTGKKEPTETDNEPDDQKVRQAAKNALADLETAKKPGRMILKELAVLFQFRTPQADGS
jgi:hypothetical protein